MVVVVDAMRERGKKTHRTKKKRGRWERDKRERENVEWEKKRARFLLKFLFSGVFRFFLGFFFSRRSSKKEKEKKEE